MTTVKPQSVPEVGDQGVERRRADRVETRSRLIKEQNLRIERQGASQRGALDHSARKLRGRLVAVVDLEADQLDLEPGKGVHERFRQIKELAHRDRHVLRHRNRREQCAELEQHAPAPFHRLGRAIAPDLLAEGLDLARPRSHQPEDRPHQDGLAGAGSADDRQDLAAPDIDVEILQDDLVVETDRQPARA